MHKPIQKILINVKPKTRRLLYPVSLFEWDEHFQNWFCGLAISYLFKEENLESLNISAQRLFSFLLTPHCIKKFFLSLEVNPVHPFHQIWGFFLEEEFAFLYFSKCCYMQNLITVCLKSITYYLPLMLLV